MNLKFLFTILFWAAVLLASSCSKGDDSNDPNEKDTTQKTTFIQGIPYSLKVNTGGASSKMSYIPNSYDATRVWTFFTEEDVAKPLVMTITGKDVSGSLTLQNVDGLFAGTLTVPADASDSLMLTATIEIPAAGQDADNYSTVSLVDLMSKCGHKYSAKFYYGSNDALILKDSKAYYHFLMSPLQRWLMINSRKYPVNKNGEVWIALDETSSIVTNFYKQRSKNTEGGKLYIIDRSGLVDLGIPNVLWADKNVGAASFVDAGTYYTWDDALTSVESPLEVPKGGKENATDNDFAILCASTAHKWCEYKGVLGACFFMPGHEDIDHDPMIFLPAGGVKQASVFSVGESGMYWSATKFDSKESYRFFFNPKRFTTESRVSKSWGNMLVRPIVHYNVKGNNNTDETPVGPMELQPFFPDSYSWDDVAAWYTSRNDDEMYEWALYLLKNNKYVLTKYLAKTDTKIIQNSGDYTVVGDADADYQNFDIEATVWHRQKTVHFENGECNFQKVQLHQERIETPLIAKCTKDNSNTSILYYPWLGRDPVVAWYKQVDANDDEEDFMAFYLYGDGDYDFVKCWIRDGEQTGSLIFDGYLIGIDDVSQMDLRNMSADIFRNESGYKHTGELSIVDGVLTISGYSIKMKIQDVNLFSELLGL